MTRATRVGIVLAVLLIVGGTVTGCDESGEGTGPTAAPTTPDAPAETTAPPAETSPPAETTPPDSTTDEEAQWWVLLIVLGGLFILFVALLAGRSRRTKTAPAAAPVWKAHAQRGYAEARWLSDNLTESLAIWHGDAEFVGDATGATDAARQKAWDQLGPRMERATAELYALEAAAGPGSPALVASQRTIAALEGSYAAVNERSDARAAYRTAAESSDEVSPADLTAARDREVRASAGLTTAHQQLTAALTELSPIA